MNITVVAAHPDDEILGCGGAIARHVAGGDNVSVVIMAEGLSARTSGRATDKELAALKECAKKANAILGVSDLTLLEFPDNRMDSVDRLDVIQAVEKIFARTKPDLVYTHHHGDANVDHRVICESVLVAARPLPGSTVNTILHFEIPSSTHWLGASPSFAFCPQWFTDISGTLNQKMEALKAYAGEMRDWPHARSYRAVESLARWRGSLAGKEAAEAFELSRHIR